MKISIIIRILFPLLFVSTVAWLFVLTNPSPTASFAAVFLRRASFLLAVPAANCALLLYFRRSFGLEAFTWWFFRASLAFAVLAFFLQPTPPNPQSYSNQQQQIAAEFTEHLSNWCTKSNNLQAATMSSGAMTLIYQPRSFASASVIQAVRDALASSRASDQASLLYLNALIGKTRERVNLTNWTTAQKNMFLQATVEPATPILSALAALSPAKIRWIASSESLYTFALMHHRDYRVTGETIVFKDAALSDAFNSRLQEALALQKTFLAQYAAAIKMQNESMHLYKSLK